ncbi:nucleotidyltransferase family protein [Loktanella sp. D2R18]|uniref:nucleotidyltransferase family protein n=1 Tax=Rhodobacterales TaxID=204455 RepID=UPI000DEAD0AA|nr:MULTISPECIES: nucleotidyltransferase family protein [Rhodobacterales]MDO6589358.1 nucleotidyltransferase family protein [Yoonia sp. 1_MG-2023]RBW45229.1 nucleotidyltransferase family protein [Loktanella sp. D2R18]
MNEIGTILLAAGLSARMGARNKLLLPIAGVPMIRHMVEIYSGATGRPVLVVTGHEADQIEDALRDSPAIICFNPDFEQGQARSVACGLQHAPAARRLLIGLGDQPRLQPKDLGELIDAHDTASGDKISIPQWQGQRGNPILIPTSLRARLLEDPRAPGCKKFTRAYPEQVQFHALPNPGFYADVDTSAAYAALHRTFKEATV